MNPTVPNLDDREIAEALRHGSADAFRSLYHAHGRSILAYLTRLTGRKEMAEELTQETFLTTIRKISFFRTGPDGGLRAWVFRIATNLALDALRREKRIEIRDDIDHIAETNGAAAATATPVDELEKSEFTQALASALLKLTPAQRTIFILREQEEMSLLEISRVCGCGENSVKQSLFRARAALRRQLCQ